MQSLPTEPGIIIRRIYIAHLMDIPFIARTQCRMGTAILQHQRFIRSLSDCLRAVWLKRRGRLRIIRTQARTNKALPSQLLTAGKALGKPTTPTPEPTRQRIRDPARPRSGGNRTFEWK